MSESSLHNRGGHHQQSGRFRGTPAELRWFAKRWAGWETSWSVYQKNWRRSPAWPVVAALGALAFGLTLLLFLGDYAGLSASTGASRSGERTGRTVTASESIDARLVGYASPTVRKYPADFLTGNAAFAVSPLPALPKPVVPETPVVVRPAGRAQIDLSAQFRKYRSNFPPIAAETLTALSEPDRFLASLEIGLAALGTGGWNPATNQSLATQAKPIPYTGLAAQNLTAWSSRSSPADTPSERSAEITIGALIELLGPRQSRVGELARSSILIQPQTDDDRHQIVIKETLPPPATLVQASPEGVMQSGVLERQVDWSIEQTNLPLEIGWVAEQPGTVRHVAALEISGEVSTTTQVDPLQANPLPQPVRESAPEPEVRPRRRPRPAPLPAPVLEPAPERVPAPVPTPVLEPAVSIPVEEPAPTIDPTPAPEVVLTPRPPKPTIACRVQGADRITVGQLAHFEVEVENTSVQALHDVIVLAEVPVGLRHLHGSVVEHFAGTLQPGEVHRAALTLQGVEAGESVPRVMAVSSESATALTKTRLTVNQRPVTRRPTPQPEVNPPAVELAPTGCCRCPIAAPLMIYSY